jgi:hypothetical protein
MVHRALPESFAPDLAAEAVSPSDSVREMVRKVMDDLDAGTRIVRVADPASRTVTVVPGLDNIRVLRADELGGSGV